MSLADHAVSAPTRSPLPRTRASRWGAWLLALSPLYFAAVVVVNITAFARTIGTGLFADITAAQMAEIGPSWILASTLFPLAFVLGTAGVILLAASLLPLARAWAAAAIAAGGVCVLGFLPYAPVRIAAMGFTEERLGDNALYTSWDWAYAPAAATAALALVLLCAAMATSTARRTAAVVTGGLGLVLVITTALSVPAPPFLLSFLWCAMGVVWLRGTRAARPQS